MSKFRKINTGFWRDEKILEEFTPEDRYFYLYLMTNEKTTQIGVYKLSIKEAAFEMGYDKDTVKKLITRFEDDYGLIKYNYETKEIAILNWADHQVTPSGKPMADCLLSESEKVNDKLLIDSIYENIRSQRIKDFYGKNTNRGQVGGQVGAPTWVQEKEEEKEEEEEKEKEDNNHPYFSDENLRNIFRNVAEADEDGLLTYDHKKARANAFYKEMMQSQQKIEDICRLFNKTESQVKHSIQVFNDKQFASDNMARNFKQHWQHFVNWIQKAEV